MPLIGFSGAPFTLFGYMVEGGGSRTWDTTRRFMYTWPDATHAVMQRLTEVTVEYLVLQVEAGAQLLEVFDTNVGCLSPHLWETFVQPYLLRIASEVKAQLRSRGLPVVPMTVFPKGAHWALASLSHSEYDCVSIDWSTSPKWARQQVGDRVALQGNLGPGGVVCAGGGVETVGEGDVGGVWECGDDSESRARDAAGAQAGDAGGVRRRGTQLQQEAGEAATGDDSEGWQCRITFSIEAAVE